MTADDSPLTATPLAQRVSADANPAHIAEATVAIWHEIDDALTPIIGQQGVVAVFRRSLHLSAAAHPWLIGAHHGSPGNEASPPGSTGAPEHLHENLSPAALQIALAQQTRSAAVAGGNAFLQAVYGLLASLIGSSLTERLLRSVRN